MDSFPEPHLSVHHANNTKPQTSFQKEYERYRQQSARWRAMTLAVEMRAKGMCEICLRAKGTECAHLTYERIFNERMTDLLGVCHKCHWKLDESLRNGR
jgi:hypothetical protein